MTILDSLTIGIFQGIAIIPGISRSGSTIVAGLLRGLDRSLATEFSFFYLHFQQLLVLDYLE